MRLTHSGNSKIVQIFDANIDSEPPYFVMKYYKDGDLTNLTADLVNNYELQENIFNKMISCLSEVHARNQFHRDVKPQNFLRDGDNIVVSDFGLSMEIGSHTQLTRSSMFWGTQGYLPPEYSDGGFKHASAQGDIFMLGKSFYSLLTKRNPIYLSSEGIPPPMYHVIERCCNYDREKRYETLADLKQNLKLVFDVLLSRGGVVGQINQLLSAINDKLEKEGQYFPDEVRGLIDKLSLLDDGDKKRIFMEIHKKIFIVVTQEEIKDKLPQFIDSYGVLVDSGDYGWGYAEIITDNMNIIFGDENLDAKIRGAALQLAITAAYKMNRFAAMDTCIAMVTSITDKEFGLVVSQIIQDNSNTFIADIEPSECKSDSIRQSLIAVKA
jgi:serine/threonine protein kinase